ncbi:MAG TPA: hypothetical protein VL524_02450, partial [Gemmatimonadaceae bacterium]|nr:hypothetical protein [Gemmatimonadaceae bacterium]
MGGLVWLCWPCVVFAQSSMVPSAKVHDADSVTLRIVNTELRTAVQIIQQYLDRPVIFAGPNGGQQVTLELPRPIPRADVPRLLRGLLDAQGYELLDDTASGTYRARLKEPSRPNTIAAAPTATPSRDPRASPQLFVIALKHARAADVANTINALFGRTTGVQPGTNASHTPTLGDELRASQIPPTDPAPLPQTVPGTAGRVATITGELTIVPDTHG